MRAALALLACLALAACREEAPAPVPVFAPPAEAEAACSRAGGEFLRAGGGRARACIHTMPDAGKQCRVADDCQGDCLARSGSCAPVSPLYGCHEIVMSNGARAMQCRD